MYATLGTLLRYLPPLSSPRVSRFLSPSFPRRLYATRTVSSPPSLSLASPSLPPPRRATSSSANHRLASHRASPARASLIGRRGAARASEAAFSRPLICTARVPRTHQPAAIAAAAAATAAATTTTTTTTRHHHHHRQRYRPTTDRPATPYGHESGVTDAALSSPCENRNMPNVGNRCCEPRHSGRHVQKRTRELFSDPLAGDRYPDATPKSSRHVFKSPSEQAPLLPTRNTRISPLFPFFSESINYNDVYCCVLWSLRAIGTESRA